MLAYDVDRVFFNADESAEAADYLSSVAADPVRVRAVFGAIEHDVEVSPGGGFMGDACQAWVPSADLALYGAGVSPGRHTGTRDETLVRYPDEEDATEPWRILNRRRATPDTWELDLVRLSRPIARQGR